MNVNFSKIQYDHKISSFSIEQEDLLTCFLAGINSDCFTVNKRISFENKKGFFNILASGASKIFSNSDIKVKSSENIKADTEKFKLLPEEAKKAQISKQKQEMFEIYKKNVED